jgi:lipopolysaccharide transport protein LptA
MKLWSTRHPAFLRVSTTALVFLGVAPLLTAATKTEEYPPNTSYEASHQEFDFKNHVTYLKGDVRIFYGKMTARADQAMATGSGDFKNGRWKLDGNVHINAEPHGDLRSDEAIVEFEDHKLIRATATGSPAEFDQKRAGSDMIAHGHADQIVYEVDAGTVRLSNDAWVTDGEHELTAPVIVYNLREEHVEATTSPGTDKRVHVTLSPNDVPKTGASAGNKSKTPATGASKSQPPTPQAAAPQSPPKQ